MKEKNRLTRELEIVVCPIQDHGAVFSSKLALLLVPKVKYEGLAKDLMDTMINSVIVVSSSTKQAPTSTCLLDGQNTQ